MKNRIQQLQDDRLVARALFVAAEAVALYPYNEIETSKAMMELLQRLHPSLIDIFQTSAEIETIFSEEETLREADRILASRGERTAPILGYAKAFGASVRIKHRSDLDDIPF